MAQEVSITDFEKGVLAEYGTNELCRRKIVEFAKKYDYRVPKQVWNNKTSEKRGATYIVSEQQVTKTQTVDQSQLVETPIAVKPKAEVEMVGGIKAIRSTETRYTIDKDPNFIRWGNFSDFRAIIKANRFFPTFVTGLSGNGKTTGIEQACAAEGRECIRFNFTRETGADDLLGGLRLIDGDTVFQYGPIAEAYMRGAILILDECLEENEEVRVGKVNEWVPMKLKDMNFGQTYPVVSFNQDTGKFENDTASIISDKDDDLYEVELEDGSTVVVNSKHPFVVGDGKETKTIEDGLIVGAEVVVA